MGRQGKIALNFKFLGKICFSVAFVFFYCEFIHYYVVIRQCDWPKLDPESADVHINDKSNSPLHAMVLADTHLLGNIKGHWFDKLRREWQMHRAFQTTITLHKPDVVIFLGDLFDEGKWCSDDEFEAYISRFHKLFSVPEETKVLVAAGNHDMGFHYSLSPRRFDRFEEAFSAPAVKMVQISGVIFILINSMAMEGDDCFLCKPAAEKIKIITNQLQCSREGGEICKDWKDPALTQYSKPILLQHYPLFRESDAECKEPDEAPDDEKLAQFRERWECLSREATDTLLQELTPRLALSGHTHHGCHVKHRITEDLPNTMHEYTIPSFSWRNKKSPTFSMLTLTPSNYAVYKCHMPKESSVYAMYIIAFILLLLWILRKRLQVGGFVYKHMRYVD